MRKKIFSLLIICLLACTQCVIANEIVYSKDVKKVGKLISQSDASNAVSALQNLSPKDRIALAFWILENYEKVPPIYFIFLTDDVFTINPQKAANFYFIGRIRATEDVSMCEDKTAMSQISIYPLLAPNTMEFLANQKDDKIVKDALKSALEWDKKHSKRVSPVWACYHGISAFNSTPALKPQKEFSKIQKGIWESIEQSLKNSL